MKEKVGEGVQNFMENLDWKSFFPHLKTQFDSITMNVTLLDSNVKSAKWIQFEYKLSVRM